jgi:tetratricopeptide (TPR) repeat protein
MRAFPILFVLASACASSPGAGPSVPLVNTAPVGDVPLFEGLGTHGRKVATSSREAQRYFDQGLAFVFAFNHDEAIRAFSRAAELDPQCAMAHWGVALANGPHINNPEVDEAHAKAAWAALQRARAATAHASASERALIDALAKRYADPQPADRKPLDAAFADAMRAVWRAHPEDADVGALFAEAMMDLRPWDLWTAEGKPQPGTEEIVTTLEAVLARSPNHPLAIHLYIHAVEASPNPERADGPADRLRDLQPALGHMVHMPSHIDVRRGRWQQAVVANEKAIEADRVYRRMVPKQGFYTIYMAHNRHMLAYAAMMQGQSKKAISAIREMADAVPPELVKAMPLMVDGYLAMPVEVYMRFGEWAEILAAPEPPPELPLSRALRLYARGVAFAAQGDVAKARAEQAAFAEAKGKIPKDETFGNNPASDVAGIAEKVLSGEIAIRENKTDAAIADLEEAVRREDALRYDEPPDWIQPVRHALGATLVRAGKHAQAEAVYRADLKKLPNNGWSLYGLARALKHQKKDADAGQTEAQFRKVWEKGDVTLSSSCFCLPGI